MAAFKYRPEIDGLRAVAVIPVILFHLNLSWILGGFVGVDVFFVISGYLISTIIVQEFNDGRFTYSQFWLRRLRRILPALVTLVIITSLLGRFDWVYCDLSDLGYQGVGVVLSFANIAMWEIPGGYWGQNAESSLFLHTWSLSVEEQFYFVYPFLLISLMKWRRNWTFCTIAGLALGSFLLYVWGYNRYPSVTFYFLPTRAWELATGCLIALSHLTLNSIGAKILASTLSLIGLVAIIGSCFVLSPENQFAGCLAIPVFGSALVILFGGNPHSFAYRFLSSRPTVFIGKISYSLYLWHWPIAVMARERGWLGESIIMLIPVLLAIGSVSLLSYQFVEQPMRHKQHILVPSLIALTASLCLSMNLYLAIITPNYTQFTPVTSTNRLYNTGHDLWREEAAKMKLSVAARMTEGINAPQRSDSPEAFKTGGVIKAYGRKVDPDVVVLGDSHALMWSGVIDNICQEFGATVSFYGADGESAFFEIPVKAKRKGHFFTADEQYLYDTKRIEFLSQWKPKVVVLVSCWSNITKIEEAEDTIRFIGNLGAKVLLIEQPPMLLIGNTNAPRYVALRMVPKINERQFLSSNINGKYQRGREMIRMLCETNPFCRIVPVTDIYYESGKGVCVLDGFEILYIDEDHLSVAGANKCRSRIRDELAKDLSR